MRVRAALALVLAACPVLAEAEQTAAPAQNSAPSDSGDLYQTAKQLFDQYAPPDIKAQYDFPSKDQFDQYLAGLQQATDSGSIQDLGAYAPQARTILAALRTQPQYAGAAAWLGARLDEIEFANQIAAEPGHPPPAPVIPEAVIPPVTTHPAAPDIPYYHRWLDRMRDRPLPPNADTLMPVLRRAFEDEGVPPQLAWLAEVESSLNPEAQSPSGARGLFQLKAETARGLGLSTFLPDDRTNPEKSAHAAARDLRALGERFGTWPLALAAYNAGQGRLSRALASRHATDFAEVAPALSGETRLYVPEVCALITIRTGLTPGEIPPPR